MILKVLIFCATFVVGSFASCGCAPKSPPLRDLYEIVQDFPTVNFCNRTFNSNWWVGPGNVRKVTFNGPINEHETARELCKCFYDLINQKTWLNGAEKKCYHYQCNNTVTLEFSGQPDPTYNPYSKLTLDRPLKKLKVIAEQFKDKTQMFGVNCRSHWLTDKCNCTHVMIQCPIDCGTDATKFCHRIIDYFNQKTDNGKGWLQNSITHCNTRGKVLEVEFIGKTEEGVVSTAPRYYRYEKSVTSSLVVREH
ncbi:uncharacterized protein LOC119084093 [Bradysia coprophila]|uniref:uncharacterized protein LOC119084093 n=1 Tax=Bradysia coprophila TaxID=38358 RepID=UPI00187D9903|nr:uncharacterized protein LOC119084093 [Bradysia coprophila]